MNKTQLILDELRARSGVLRLAPCWVARNFMQPGRRLKLDPRDIYAYGGAKGGIDERWFASATPADNAEFTVFNEGLSYLVVSNGGNYEKILFREAVELAGGAILGEAMMNRYGGWRMYAKFFDNMGPIAHHVHLKDEHAAKVGALGKPEGYYFPIQQNNVGNNFPHTFFGLNPGTRPEDIVACLERWATGGDNGILDLSQAFRLELGTGWDVPPGILHAPGSVLTYEPQRASDVSIFFQSLVEGRFNARATLEKDIPKDKHYDYEYYIEILDWAKNVDPEFKKNRHIRPVYVSPPGESREKGYFEKWVVYGCADFCAKELTVLPGRTAVIADCDPYGLIMLQGRGTINGNAIETPVVIRFGQLTNDEMFVARDAALQGVEIANHSQFEEIVMLKHFGPDNADARSLVKAN
ncbi:MAG: hypothetical protein LBJ10_00605 [Clostridiales bacterium]|jgi:hypothetical protein|nr:hypothetical protein [Clostridiales bacterium]